MAHKAIAILWVLLSVAFGAHINAQGFQNDSLSSLGGVDASTPQTPMNFVASQPMPSGMVNRRFSESDALSSGLNFNEFPKDFTKGITLQQGRWAVKFGGYVKADLITDAGDPLRMMVEGDFVGRVQCDW